jgi:potassium efflux system protein
MDLEEVSQQSLRLTRIMLLLVFGVAFCWLWSDLVAVFTYLDSVVLWHKSEGTGANAVLYPISLSDVLTGLFVFGAALSLAATCRACWRCWCSPSCALPKARPTPSPPCSTTP